MNMLAGEGLFTRSLFPGHGFSYWGHTDCCFRLYLINNKWAETEKQIQQMLQQGVIQPSQSPWGASRTNGIEAGWFQILLHRPPETEQPDNDANLLPRINYTLEALHWAQYFTILHTGTLITVCQGNKYTSAFCTSSGQLCKCEAMAFEICRDDGQ